LKKISAWFKSQLWAGFLVVIPIAITVYVIQFLIDFIDTILEFLPAPIHPYTYLPVHIPGLGLILLILLVFITGILVRNYVGNRLVNYWEMVVGRIPVVRGIYQGTKQLMEALFGHKEGKGRRVVMLQFPRPGIYSLGFVTGMHEGEVRDKTQKRLLNVFIPCTPNPTTGYYVLVPEEEATPLSMSAEDAFKLIISGGIITPQGENGSLKNGPPPSGGKDSNF
jgi:uncharacterized membrane protein